MSHASKISSERQKMMDSEVKSILRTSLQATVSIQRCERHPHSMAAKLSLKASEKFSLLAMLSSVGHLLRYSVLCPATDKVSRSKVKITSAAERTDEYSFLHHLLSTGHRSNSRGVGSPIVQ